MGIIRFSDEEVFNTDSSEYEILYNGALAVKDLAGGAVEIGTRRGGSAKMIIDALAQGLPNRPMFCIDPYGNIEIECTNLNITKHFPGMQVEGDPNSVDITQPVRVDYTNDMRNRIIPSLYYYAYSKGMEFTFFCLEDKEFFNRYSDGVPTYNQEKIMINEYAFVFFDGPHDNESLDLEIGFFIPRSVIGTVFVFDDIWMYDHDKYEKQLFDVGFETLQKGSIKASYRRVK